MRKIFTFIFTAISLSAVAAFSLACTAADKTQDSITIYSGRSEELVGPLIDQFSDETGIRVDVRYGGTPELAATILEEGKNSPADIFYATDPGGLGAIEELFADLPDDLTNKVNPLMKSSDNKWIGISGRARVIIYNTEKISEGDLPDDIWDFTSKQWEGRIGWAPTNASFQTMVTAMLVLWGEEKTSQWLMGIQANKPKSYDKNTAIVSAVGNGEIDVGFTNHYYLFRFLEEQGGSFAARNYYFTDGGPASVLLVSGAGILQTSKNQENAQKFLEYMISETAQDYFANQTFEYPVIEGIDLHPLLKPLSDISIPSISISELADLRKTLSLLRDTGIVP